MLLQKLANYISIDACGNGAEHTINLAGDGMNRRFAIASMLAAMRLTQNHGWWLLSPQAIGILAAAVVMLAFRVLAPAPAVVGKSVLSTR